MPKSVSEKHAQADGEAEASQQLEGCVKDLYLYIFQDSVQTYRIELRMRDGYKCALPFLNYQSVVFCLLLGVLCDNCTDFLQM